MNPTTTKLATLLGTASLLTLADVMAAQAQQMAQATPQEVPEQVLITGSLIRGTAAVGVPVTNLSPQDFAQTGALTTADLFRTVPSANVSPGPVATQSGANIERATRVNLRGLDTGNAVRSLLLVDGIMVPPQGNGQCEIDPSIIPALSQDRIDILVDGASATYGSNAIGGVINIVLKRGYDGAITQLRYTTAQGGKNRYMASQLWGRTWDGGDITLAYEWYDDSAIQGSAKTSKWRNDYTPWGLDNRITLASSMPGTISTAAPQQPASLGLGTSASLGTNCSNCWAIPTGTGGNFNAINGGLGPTAPFSGSTLNWTTFNVAGNAGTNGTRNEFDPFSIAWFDAAQQRNAATITVDQRLTRNTTFYGEGFYSNRRAQFINPASLSPANNNILSVSVPTFNPYYPTGGAPTNLRVNYTTSIENPSITSAYEVADRYLFGIRVDLPGNWTGDIYMSETYDSSFNHVQGTVNKNAVSAALGWTIAPSLAVGTQPGIASWTKPSSVPYLNLFCDARQFQCNSSSTLNYVSGLRSFNEKFWSNEKGIKFDGPLFALPAGDVKAAIGATYNSYHFDFTTFDNTSAPSLVLPYLNEPRVRQVWATFAQINIPVIGDANALPLMRRLDIEASWRHDQYSDVGGTSNPKIAFNWTVDEDIGLTIRGAWGTSFRAPFFGETSALANVAITSWNVTTSPNAAISLGTSPEVGSLAYRLQHPTIGGAFAANATPGGISMNGGSRGSEGLRSFDVGNQSFTYNGGTQLDPEKAMNWAFGGEFAPTTFLKGLDIQATWYQTKITGALSNFGNPTSTGVQQGGRGFAYISPTDLIAFDPACNNNLTPTTCVPFENMVRSLLANPRNTVVPAELTNIYWINDGGTFNKGDIKLSGIDWTASYDYDAGDLGAWNIGIVGTYYLHNYTTTIPGAAGLAGTPLDSFHTDLSAVGGIAQNGVESLPRMRYRARLGWADGPWSVTGFMDYQSHFFHTQSAPPNVNFQCVATGSTTPGGTFPCLINNYSNLQPPQYTFDLSIGYDTAETPANDYLKHVGVQLVIQNIMDKAPAFQYRIQAQGGNPAAYDILKSYQGRTISLILTKTW